MKNFVIIGAAGYIAQRHIKCISDLGHNLVAVCDPSDSIGIIDKYFKDAQYFNCIEDLTSFLVHPNFNIDYIVICSPNYLHFSHMVLFMDYADIICEKPLVINYHEITYLKNLAESKKRKIYPILQARIHPVIQKIKKLLEPGKRYKVNLTYMSARGDWYNKSWKGDLNKSGGLLMNIGIHGFDALTYLFGMQEGIFKTNTDGVRHAQYAKGQISYKNADVNFEVSTLLKEVRKYTNKNVIRRIEIKGLGTYEFSDGFCDLHIELYKKILSGEWNIDINSLVRTIQLCRSNEYV